MSAPLRTRVKFCGATSVADARLALASGADAIGVILAESPRMIDLATARAIRAAIPAATSIVGVFADNDSELVRGALDAGIVPQFSGDESPEFCNAVVAGRPYYKVFHVGEADLGDLRKRLGAYAGATAMFDTASGGKRGGTGVAFAWNVLQDIAASRAVVVAGGLTPENVGVCVRTLRPYMVDVRSGIESSGVKDENKMRAFVRAVKEANAQPG